MNDATSSVRPTLPPTVDVQTAARFLGISRATAYNAVHSGDIPSFRVRKRIMIPTLKLLEMVIGADSKGEAA